MRIATTLADAPGGETDVIAVHDHLPPGLPPADNEAGWREALDKLAALLEGRGEAPGRGPARPWSVR
jgi:hypothetical protein